MIVLLFLKKKAMKNQIHIFFVVIVSFPLFSILNMANQRFFYFSRSTKKSYFMAKRYLEIFHIHFQ